MVPAPEPEGLEVGGAVVVPVVAEVPVEPVVGVLPVLPEGPVGPVGGAGPDGATGFLPMQVVLLVGLAKTETGAVKAVCPVVKSLIWKRIWELAGWSQSQV